MVAHGEIQAHWEAEVGESEVPAQLGNSVNW